MIILTQIINTEIFEFITAFELLIREVFSINRKDNRNCFKKITNYCKPIHSLNTNFSE